MTGNVVKWSKMTPEDHEYGFWGNWEKIFKNFSVFGGGDGPSNRFFERAPTFTNFLRLDSDRISRGLQFALYDGLKVAKAQKLLRNYEIFMVKS